MIYKALLDDVRRGVIGPVFAAIVATVITAGLIMVGIAIVHIAIIGFPIGTGVAIVALGVFGLFLWYFRSRRYSE